MTPVLMQFLTSTGQPLGMANVEIRLSRSDFDEEVSGIIMPRLINAVTGLDGKLLIDLMPCDSRYHVTVYDTVSDTALHYHFYVPHLNTPGTIVRLQDLIVADDAVIDPVSYDVTAMLTILDAKANVLAAISRGELARDRAEAAAQFADDSIMATVDARNGAQTAALQVQVNAAQVAIDKQNVHDNTLLTEDRAAVVLQSKVDVLAAASASLASATAASNSANAAADSAYEADQSKATAIAARDATTDSLASANTARDVAISARDVTVTAQDITLTARDVATAARDTAVTKADQLASQLHAFNEIYLGKFAVAPMLDGNGNTLKVGAIYENTIEGKIYQWESDLAWHAYDEESQLQLNNATLAASNAAASAASALALKNAAADSATAAANSATVTAGLVTAAADSASASLASQNMAAQSVVDANSAKVTAIDAKNTATAKAAEVASYATQIINGVLSTVLDGLSTASSLVISASDSVLAAFGKLQSQISLRAMKDNAVLTGTPTAPTAAGSTSSEQIATTKFVRDALGLFGIGGAVSLGVFDLNAAGGGTFISVNGFESDSTSNHWPSIGVSASTPAWWNVLTIGVASRTTQIATHGFNFGAGRTFIRYKHDTTWYPWKEVAFSDTFLNALNLKAPLESPTFTGNVKGINKGMVGLGNVDNTSDADKPVSVPQAAALATKQDASLKDASGGFAGLTAFKLNLKNATGAITSFLVSGAITARTWTFPDKDGTVAMISDIPAAYSLPIATAIDLGGVKPDGATVTIDATGKLSAITQGVKPNSGQSTNTQITYSNGNVSKIVEVIAGVTYTTTATYNADGSLAKMDITDGVKTRTETYSYTAGVLTGFTATEV